jgi:hypothetical protein
MELLMQRLQSLFRRNQATRASVVPAGKPTPLSLDALKLVSGGLPRVSRSDIPEAAVVAEAPLPRVS